MANKIILLAEDNPDDALLTIHALKESHLCNEIIHVRDGVEALSGLEVLRQIRANPVTKRLPVVMLTTSKEEQDLVASYDLGANSYVRKPVDFDQFTEAARNLGMYWLLLNELAPKD